MRSNKSSKLLVSLAVSDSIIGYNISPLMAYQLFHQETFFNCQIKYVRDSIIYAISPVSSLTVAFIAYDRYISLTKPLLYRVIVTHGKVNRWIVVSWFIPVSLASFIIIGKTMYFHLTFILTRTFIAVSVSVIVLTIISVYFLIARTIERRQQQILPGKYGNTRNYQANLSIKLANKVSVIVICYMICFIPASIGVLALVINYENKQIIYSVEFHQYMICIPDGVGQPMLESNRTCNETSSIPNIF